ncbi:cupin-like domain-containing protein [Silvibacterium sp.]|uniref:cupin-like domain-containing protein n=1 Tax=Silvibacterium sp. TaxID=1964179 RepID=UPI0039E26FE2
MALGTQSYVALLEGSMSTTAAVSTGQAAEQTAFHSIERRSSADLPYERFLKEYLEPNRPVIISNAAPQWNAMRTWTPEFFKSRYGEKIFQVSYETKMAMSDLIDAIMASTQEKPGPYLHKVIIYRDMPELLEDLFPDNVYAFPRRYAGSLMPARFRRPDGFLKLLIGGAGGKFPLMHYDADNSHAMITEIYGDKEFILFPPEDTPYVYPFPNSSHTSQIDNPDSADLEKFPLFSRATLYRGTVHPGDAILIPSAWWHAARALNPSISVCTNMMYRSNWHGFVHEACDPAIIKNPLSRVVKHGYLDTLGLMLSACESLQQALPDNGLSHKLADFAPLHRRHMPTRAQIPSLH